MENIHFFQKRFILQIQINQDGGKNPQVGLKNCCQQYLESKKGDKRLALCKYPCVIYIKGEILEYLLK